MSTSNTTAPAGPRHLAKAPGLTTVELSPARRMYEGRHRADSRRPRRTDSHTQVLDRQLLQTIRADTKPMSVEEIAALTARRQPVEEPYAVGVARLGHVVEPRDIA